jgi:hypothetical protein
MQNEERKQNERKCKMKDMQNKRNMKGNECKMRAT